MACNRLEKFLSSGAFGNAFEEIPEDMKTHIRQCRECEALFGELSETEAILVSQSKTVVEPAVKYRIKRSVMDAIEPKNQRSPFLVFNPVWAGAVIIFITILAIYTLSPGNIPVQQNTWVALTDLDPELMEETLIDSMNLSEVDETLIFTAVADQFDDALLDAAWNDIESGVSRDLNDEDVITELSGFQDSDWEALRRYLS